MENQDDTLQRSLEQYATQLAQIQHAISSTSSSTEKQDLYALKKDVEELISLTKETQNTIKQSLSEDDCSKSEGKKDKFTDEYALFKAELAELEGSTSLESADKQEPESTTIIPENLQEDLDALKGSKCQAPHGTQWQCGDVSFHNALIMDVVVDENMSDMANIKVKVMFVNPTEKSMLPCPYYLDGECRFADDKCHFSHGELIPLSEIKEYKEPEFSLIKENSAVLAKWKDSLWHRAKVKQIQDSKCTVQFESKGRETVELDLHDLMPLHSGREDSDDSSSSLSSDSGSSSCSDSEGETVPTQHQLVQLSLLRNPPSVRLGAWEKYTKGIGSRLMANMGYVVGSGLGKCGEGRLEPVEAMAYPPGKSLDACMALREAADGDQDLFKAERRMRKQQNRQLMLQKQQQLREQTPKRPDVFSFINSRLSGNAAVAKPETSSSSTPLASSSRQGLNIERFRLGENIKKVEKDIMMFKQTLKRHDEGSTLHNVINNKLGEAQQELSRLHNSDKLVMREQNHREGQKKISIF